MTKRSIFEGYQQKHEIILNRFPLAPVDWANARKMRDRHPVSPWTDDDRQDVLDWNQFCQAGELALKNIEKLGDPATRVIVTGQQAGIALGPLYTLYKALGCILHAKRQEDLTGTPVIPMFWVASEDHDFEEVRRVAWLNKDGVIEKWQYEDADYVQGRSMSDVVVDDFIWNLVERWDHTTIESEFKQEVLAWLKGAIDNAENLDDFFCRLLAGLTGEFGLVMVTPRLSRIRREALRMFEIELRDRSASSRAVIAAGKSLAAAGYTPALHRREEDINFFIYENGLRCKLSWRGDGIVAEHGGEVIRECSAEALLEEVRENPQKISTNVVSRPLTQDAALPTLAYIGGPGEIAYFAQLREVYSMWEVAMPMIVPRPRVALVDARTRRSLEKAGISVEAAMDEDEKPLNKAVALRSGAEDSLKALESAQQAMANAAEDLRQSVAGLSPAVAKAVERLMEAQKKSLGVVEERVEQEIRQRDEAQMRRLEAVRRWLRPDGHPQERVYSVLSPLLVQYGMGVVEKIASAIDLDDEKVQVINL